MLWCTSNIVAIMTSFKRCVWSLYFDPTAQHFIQSLDSITASTKVSYRSSKWPSMAWVILRWEFDSPSRQFFLAVSFHLSRKYFLGWEDFSFFVLAGGGMWRSKRFGGRHLYSYSRGAVVFWLTAQFSSKENAFVSFVASARGMLFLRSIRCT